MKGTDDTRAGNRTGPDPRTDEEFFRDRDTFHEHLDRCSRCRGQVFNMCPTGQALLRRAALGEEKKWRG